MNRCDADVLIAGAGIMGLTIARELVSRGWENIVLLEKESRLGGHASGRNSGVLHAGIYYAPDSLKARSCLHGNFLMKEYCREKGLPLLETGKVIVARGEEELPVLKELYRRATANGAKVELVDEKRLAEIEPNARTVSLALHSLYTAVVDPLRVLESLGSDLEASGKVRILRDCPFLGLRGSSTAKTPRGEIAFGRFVNAAGAHCDRVAAAFGAGSRFRMVPFKGLYRKLRKDRSHLVRGNIYPVPDIRYPFLGVHFTRNVHGEVYLGPTAIPALGRENYGVLEGVDREGAAILARDAALFFSSREFRSVALEEPRKYRFSCFFEDARKLVKDLRPEDVTSSDKVGIRAQLVDWRTRKLVQDFLLVEEGPSLHLLNPVSPAFTSSMNLARAIVDRLQ